MNNCNVFNDSITGVAGFIGFHLSCKLIREGLVIGIDNINSYYDISLKEARLKFNQTFRKLSVPFEFHKIDISNKKLKKNFPKF